jgi:hypothetical protein
MCQEHEVGSNRMKRNLLKAAMFLYAGSAAWAAESSWIIETQDDWKTQTSSVLNLEYEAGRAVPTAKVSTFQSKLKRLPNKRAASSLTITQSPEWLNWEPVSNIGPSNLGDAPVLLSLGHANYWMFGRYRDREAMAGFTPEKATLEGFHMPLKTTPFPNQYDAPGGRRKGLGGYHAWQSRDMVNWVHHGPITSEQAKWMTSAEYVDGKAYFYYDFPNDQNPHLIIDEDLADGKVGKMMGMAFNDPSDGSDAGVIRDLDGKFHLIVENWDPVNARQRSWDSPLASHAVSDTGIDGFRLLEPAVDYRTNPTGRFGEYTHPHWHAEDPRNYPGKTATEDIPEMGIKKGQTRAYATYEIHEPEQDAFGDWAVISVGGQYYLFGDFDPAGAHGRENMSVAMFTSSSIYEPFTFFGNIGQGHPDPDVMFAEGKFYLATQMKTDFVSPGPWVERVEARAGVDTNNDGSVDYWTDWQVVTESYETIFGFAKQVARIPAQLDMSDLPAGFGFQVDLKITDTTENDSKPILDKIELSFKQ